MSDHPSDDPSARTIERLVNVVALPIGRWDRDARTVFCNPPYLLWSGRARDDLIGRTLAELYGEDAWERARPAFERAFRGATTSYERLLKHGTLAGRWARVQVFPDADAAGEVHSVFTIATDIHEDVTAREALIAARVRLDRFTENIPYPLTYVDAEFVLRFVNKAYCDMAGKPADQLLGRHIGAVRGQKRWAEHEPHFRRALEGKTVQYTRLVDGLANNPDGGPRWLRTSYVPDFDERGGGRPLHRDDRRARPHGGAGAVATQRRARHADRRAQPPHHDGPHRGGDGHRDPRAGGPVLRRSRRFQGRQRPPRPPRGRCAAGQGGAGPEEERARRRCRRPLRRRRVSRAGLGAQCHRRADAGDTHARGDP
ncbi:PAS domain S-box protein [Piscinibacter aquaticus]|uniref:PAS domain S-box protein n=1 Tax=Piscinibacter aquaticus TaxID=392597 RepID=A0A5C6TZW9_9BURK|nr:PAS domain S-box protein [Piscinibacter aquaticus]